jgi:hypothetical protein
LGKTTNYLILVGKSFGTRPYDKMGLPVEQVVWMEDDWNWLTIMSSGCLNVYPMDSNVARWKKSQHLPDPLSGVTIIGLDVIIHYC